MTRPTRSRSIIHLVGLGIVLSLLGDSTLYVVLPDQEIWSRVGLTLAWVGVLLGINRIVRVVFNTFAGVLYDRLPRRQLLIGAMALGAVCSVIYANALGPVPFAIGRVLWGLAWSGLWIGGNTIVLDISSEATRGRNSGLFQMWFFIGAAIGALAGGVFTDLFGFRGGLWVSAAIAAGGTLAWYVWLPETRPAAVERSPVKASWRDFPLRAALPASIPVMAVRFVFAGVVAATTILWLEQFIGRGLGLAAIAIPLASITGAFSAARLVTSIVGAPIAGRTSDRVGRRWPVVAVSLFIGAGGTWVMGGSLVGVALVGSLLAAIASSSAQAMAPAIIGDRIDSARRSRGLSVVYSLGDLASALGPPLALGLLAAFGISGVYRMSAVLLGVVGLFALIQIRAEAKIKTDHALGSVDTAAG